MPSLDQEIRTLRSVFWSDRDPDGRAFVPLADAYRRAGDFRQAVELLQDGLDRHPDFASAHVVAARLYLEKGLIEEAEIAARSVHGLDPDNVLGLDLLAGALEARGQVDEAAGLRARLSALTAPASVEAEPEPAAEAPGEPGAEEEVVDLAALAPDEPEEEEAVADLAALAPDEPGEEEEVVDLAALAPDEPEEEEAVVDLAALAPDEPGEEEAVVDLAALAPDEPGEEEEVVDLAALAPDEPVFDLADLAPDEPEEERVDIADLTSDEPVAPDEPEPEEEIADLAALAPDEPVFDLADLAPDEPEPEEEVVDLAALAPDEPVLDLAELAPESSVAASDEDLPSDEPPPGEPVVTRTMAELYARQGLTERALEMFRQLLAVTPGDSGLQRRIAELESAASDDEPPQAASAADRPGSGPGDDVFSGHAWDAEAHQERHEVDTPFAWTTEEHEEPGPEAPPIGGYFARLLAWEPGAGGYAAETGEAEGPEESEEPRADRGDA